MCQAQRTSFSQHLTWYPRHWGKLGREFTNSESLLQRAVKGDQVCMALGLAEHRGRKKRTTWAVFKRTLGRKPTKGQMLQPSYLPPCRSCCHHAFHHTVHAMCMHRLARTMGSRQSSIVCLHFPPQVSKPAPGVAIIHIKDPEELNLQQVSVELCFFFEVIKSHDQ